MDYGDTNGHAKVDMVKPTGSLSYKKNYRKFRKVGRGEMALPVNNKPTGCPIPNGQPRKNIHASNIIWIEQVIFVYVYVYINTYLNRITISKMRGQEFEGEPK